MENMPRFPVSWYVWAGWLAVLVAALCALLALITGLTGTRVVGAASSTLLLAGIGAMLFALFVVVMATLVYLITR